MDITRLDITILVATTIGVILMSFTFPALGLTGDKTSESDVPEFTIDGNRFDLAGDFPSRPDSPSQQRLTWGGGSRNQVWLSGGTGGGEQIFVVNGNTTSHPEAEVNIQDWDNGDVTSDTIVNLTSEGEKKSWSESGNWEGTVELVEINGSRTSNPSLTIVNTITKQPTSKDWYNRIPVVGGAVEAGKDLAATVIWIGEVIRFGFLTFWEISFNMIFVIFDIVTYVVDLLTWLTDTYLAIQGSGEISAWASVVLMIPAVIMMAEWAKVVLVVIEVIWIG